MKFLIATSNYGKLREYRELFSIFSHLDLYSLNDFPNYEAPEETGATFEENAIIKAEHAANALQMFTLADDSGLVVSALNGLPGVKSRRFAGEKASDSENRAKLISLLTPLKEGERGAYFASAIALAVPDRLIKVVSGKCEGEMVINERGSQGFGYDSLFLKYDYNKTFGELDSEIKNRISHRRRAFDKLLPILEDVNKKASCGISLTAII